MKKIKGTDCSKCYFEELDTSKQCVFDIIESIKATRKISKNSGHNYIHDYACAYAFPKDKVESTKEAFPDLDITEYNKFRRYIKYYLVIDNLKSKISLEEICEHINNLSIKPKAISVLLQTSDMLSVIEKFNEKIDSVEGMVWRIHNFKNQESEFSPASHGILSTSSHLKKCNFIWFVKDSQLGELTNNKLIERINFIANVIQPPIGILKSESATNYIEGLFITVKNYKNLISSFSQDISQAIELFLQENKESKITIYDN
ncbi:hypothetical protein EB155_04835 [archaeon]|nr:hypothetical protein [archaeon]NDB55062.1 hypothetical protein [archaeon]NDB79173.1 hypothetical protein [archaeon]